jgi:hypothetical protein
VERKELLKERAMGPFEREELFIINRGALKYKERSSLV